jgi:endonuclease YncB( thermonuclease family)
MRAGLQVAACLLALLSACSALPDSSAGRRYTRSEANARLGKFEQPGLVIGDFTLAPRAVVDGDTIKVSGLAASMRLLGIDTEETFKKDSERRRFENVPFAEYLKDLRGASSRPVKGPTPLGEDAKHFAQHFFDGVKIVRLERDHPGEIRDFYNRYLAYVLVQKNGKWVNYNIEAVRAGMSPYFTKYGYSRRFNADFLAAEKEAKAAQRGIWAPGGQHYDDYPERQKWWDARAEEIKAFEEQAVGKPNHIVLTRWDAWQELERAEGQEVVLLGAVGDVRLGDKGPSEALLSRREGQDFAVVFFDRDVFGSSGVAQRKGEYIQVRGTVTRYHNAARGRDELQIVVNLPGQVSVPGVEDHATTP